MESGNTSPRSDYTSLRSERGNFTQTPKLLGRSRLGSPIELFLPESYRPRLLILAGQHGDEPETVSLLSSALRTVLPKSLRAAVVLAINPDGVLRGTRGNAAGVDLNRNLPVPNWGTGEVKYRWTSEDPRDVLLSPGAAAASEPETKILLQVIEDLNPEYVISIHAPLACIDDPFATPLGKWLAERTRLELVPDVGYPTPGSFGTWAKERKLNLITWELPHQALDSLRLRFDPVLTELLTMESFPA